MNISSVFCHRPLLVASLAAGLLVPGRGAEADLRDVIRDDFAFAAAQYGQLLAQVKGDPQQPRSFVLGLRRTRHSQRTARHLGGRHHVLGVDRTQ
jgi:hypothetical protein